jgi:hypothetical protein
MTDFPLRACEYYACGEFAELVVKPSYRNEPLLADPGKDYCLKHARRVMHQLMEDMLADQNFFAVGAVKA